MLPTPPRGVRIDVLIAFGMDCSDLWRVKNSRNSRLIESSIPEPYSDAALKQRFLHGQISAVFLIISTGSGIVLRSNHPSRHHMSVCKTDATAMDAAGLAHACAKRAARRAFASAARVVQQDSLEHSRCRTPHALASSVPTAVANGEGDAQQAWHPGRALFWRSKIGSRESIT